MGGEGRRDGRFALILGGGGRIFSGYSIKNIICQFSKSYKENELVFFVLVWRTLNETNLLVQTPEVAFI